jgi:hypothetical protein
MSAVQILSASFADGLRMPHFVNGRLLSAEDLKAEQDATLSRLASLGAAAGYGVIDGLMVTQAGATSVAVAPGSGLNREGQLVRLPGGLTLPLAPETAATQLVDEADRFVACKLDTGGAAAPVADGAYLLTVVPASRLEGLAPLQPAAQSKLPGGCAGKWEVDGLQFKIIRLGFSAGGSTGQNRRNLLAHWAYGTVARRALARNPFAFSETYGGLDALSPADLTPCDLPLAVFYWQGGSIEFVDAWPARRRLIRPAALSGWQGLLGDRRLAEAEARFMQFQGQIDMLMQGNPAAVRATDHFRYLPPAGFLPVRPNPAWVRLIAGNIWQRLQTAAQQVALPFPSFLISLNTNLGFYLGLLSQNLVDETLSALPSAGFNLDTFFQGIQTGAVTLVARDTIDFTLHRSLFTEAIDVARQPRIRLFLVADQWLRVIEQELARIMAQRLSAFQTFGQLNALAVSAWLALVRNDLQEQLGDDFAAASGGADEPKQLYVMFVKETPAAVPIQVNQ